MNSPSRVRVELGQRGYDIVVGSAALGEIADPLRSMQRAGAKKAFVVVDTGVPQRFVTQLAADTERAGLYQTTVMVTPSEGVKVIGTFERLLKEIAASGHSRVDPVIALGGGIVGDLAGFVAASYRRGVPVIQCPSTLLSMVDASVGGKTGFNLMVEDTDGVPRLLKNLVGGFWQPSLVIADIDLLESLEPRQKRSGLAECIKHGCISAGVGHEGLLDWISNNLEPIINFEPGVITELVIRNVSLKASVVALDEREDTSQLGGRMLLNFGHTFGHAIETISHLSPVPGDPSQAPLQHGEAVGLGMIAACRGAESSMGIDSSIGDSLCRVLERAGLPTAVAGLPENAELIKRMGHDKKSTGGQIRVVYPTAPGRCVVVNDVPRVSLEAGFDSIRI